MKRLLTVAIACMLALCALVAAGCSSDESAPDPINISSSLTHESTMELTHATGFSVDYYNDGFKLITIQDEGQFLVVPEGAEAPADLSDDIVVIKQPLDQVYLVATASMDMLVSIDKMNAVTLTGTKQNGWYIQAAREAVAEGDIVYAGKYSMPDYELILKEGCDLAVESTMIYHSPEVMEALQGYGIPVMVDQSSYEEEPLGRCEWVKLYGALLNEEEAAEKAFQAQVNLFDEVSAEAAGNDSGKPTVAFFYINSNGQASVRKSTDNVPKMIETAGGTYVFSDLVDDSRSSTVKMQLETFYKTAKDADILIYNSAIEGTVDSIKQLTEKSELLANFKAVKDGNVWCTAQSMYQESMHLGEFARDVRKVIANPGIDDSELTYMYRLK